MIFEIPFIVERHL